MSRRNKILHLYGILAVMFLLSACSGKNSAADEKLKEEIIETEKAAHEIDSAREELHKSVESFDEIDSLLEDL